MGTELERRGGLADAASQDGYRRRRDWCIRIGKPRSIFAYRAAARAHDAVCAGRAFGRCQSCWRGVVISHLVSGTGRIAPVKGFLSLLCIAILLKDCGLQGT